MRLALTVILDVVILTAGFVSYVTVIGALLEYW